MPESTAPGESGAASANYPDPLPLIPRSRSGLPSAEPRSDPQHSAPSRSVPRRTAPTRSGRSRSGRSRSGRKPLPDAQAICSFAVPEIAPPYDDAPATRPASRRRLAGVPAAGADITRSGRPIAATAPPLRAVPARQSGSSAPGPGGIDRPHANPWPSRFAQVLVETLAGSRPASQIVPWTTQQTRRQISHLGPILGANLRPRVRRVIVTSPTGGVLEMTVIVAAGEHVRAVAVRLERTVRTADAARTIARPSDGYRRHRSDWLCTAIEAA